jgi:hypothetical protein
MKTFRLNSKLYYTLFEKGGDKLISVYSILKSSRDGESGYTAYKSKNNKIVSGYALLRSKTVLSLHTLKTYVPMLIDMGLCVIDDCGNVLFLGNRKVNNLYSKDNNSSTDYTKLVPIKIEKNLVLTAYNSMVVRIKSAERQQLNQICVKNRRSELLKQLENPKNSKDYKKAKRLAKKLGSKEIEVTQKTVLSLQGYALLKDNTVDNKQKGAYWKKKMKKHCGLVTKRQFTKVTKTSYEEYLFLRNSNVLSKNTVFDKNSSFILLESVSSFCFTNTKKS